MTNEERKQVLAEKKLRQEKCERMPCPRCGRDVMNENPRRNALSRHADVFICDLCGQKEAILAMMNNPLPLPEWACFNVVSPEAAAANAMNALDLKEKVAREHIDCLTALFERWQDEHEYEDFEEYRDAAKTQCPGLTELWLSPFRAEYKAADGKVVARFRNANGRTEFAVDVVSTA